MQPPLERRHTRDNRVIYKIAPGRRTSAFSLQANCFQVLSSASVPASSDSGHFAVIFVA